MAEQEDALKTRMVRALRIAHDSLTEAHLTTPVMAARQPGQPNPDALPIAILAAELFKHV
jgi:hypothetical protein